MKRTVLTLVVICSFALCLSGCGSGNDCGKVVGYSVSPQEGTADHAAAAPLNQKAFEANNVYPANDACYHSPATTPVSNLTWTTSNASVATIALGADKTQAIATCLAASSSSVTITASSSGGITGTASLICK